MASFNMNVVTQYQMTRIAHARKFAELWVDLKFAVQHVVSSLATPLYPMTALKGS